MAPSRSQLHETCSYYTSMISWRQAIQLLCAKMWASKKVEYWQTVYQLAFFLIGRPASWACCCHNLMWGGWYVLGWFWRWLLWLWCWEKTPEASGHRWFRKYFLDCISACLVTLFFFQFVSLWMTWLKSKVVHLEKPRSSYLYLVSSVLQHTVVFSGFTGPYDSLQC